MAREAVTQQAFTSAARTASVNSDPVDVERFVELIALLEITANSGTGQTLDVKLQSAYKDNPGANDWYDLPQGAFTQVTTTNGKQIKQFTNFGKKIRAVATIAGTSPSYTFEVILVGKT